MIIQFLSDLHFEFHGDDPIALLEAARHPKADLLLLLGDIAPFGEVNEEQLAAALGRLWPQTVRVMGNHEYFHGHATFSPVAIQNIPLPTNVRYVQGGALIPLRDLGLDSDSDRRLLAGTGWYSYAAVKAAGINPETGMMHTPGRAPRQFADFRFIERAPELIYPMHDTFEKFLHDELQPGDLVATHHMPSWRCVQLPYAGDPTNCFFANRFDDLIERRRPAYWFFGHTHSDVDVTIGETRCLARPRGYPNERKVAGAPPWDPQTNIVEV